MSEHLIAVWVLGPDRPGLIADVTAALVPLAVYHEDPVVGHVPGGNVAMLVTLRTEATVESVRRALRLVDTSGGLIVEAHELQERTVAPPPVRDSYVLRIHTTGRPGVLAAFSRIVARHGGRVVDFGTRVGGGRISVLRVELQQDDQATLDALERDLWEAGEQMGIGIKFYSATAGEYAPLP